jgi:hypothetical protein
VIAIAQPLRLLKIMSTPIRLLLLRTAFLASVVALFSVTNDVPALECPTASDPAETKVKGQIDASVGKLLRLTGAQLEAGAVYETRNLLGELPQADKVFLQRLMLAVYCSSLRDDKGLTETEKGERIRRYNCGVMRGLGQDPGPQCEAQIKQGFLENYLGRRGLRFGLNETGVKAALGELPYDDRDPFIWLKTKMVVDHVEYFVYLHRSAKGLALVTLSSGQGVVTGYRRPQGILPPLPEGPIRDPQWSQTFTAMLCRAHADVRARIVARLGQPVIDERYSFFFKFDSGKAFESQWVCDSTGKACPGFDLITKEQSVFKTAEDGYLWMEREVKRLVSALPSSADEALRVDGTGLFACSLTQELGPDVQVGISQYRKRRGSDTTASSYRFY